ncbi:lipid A biosynthesis lauroyl acyltransferase [Escherichia coli]|nr:lipid A biosynthesis lauroyl acyltransferase [Escherichia coli]STP77804.1 lipid A biosynthesis lauroyl acyltransferase [Escherichia coli]
MTNLPKFSTALLHPRYWLTWLGIGVLWLVVQLPYPVIYRLGCGLGKLALRFMKRRAKNCASQPGTVLPGNERTRTP